LRKYNKIRKEQLRNQKEKNSVDNYSSNMTLLEIPSNHDSIIKNIENNLFYNTDNIAYIFFDIETGGFSPTKDILQIAMKSEKTVLSVYLTPSKFIDKKASEITGLTSTGRQLFLYGKQVPTVTKRIAITKVLDYLKGFEKKVVLIAHNCNFDSSRLITLIDSLSMLSLFEDVIEGFVDTLPLFRTKFPKRKSNKLENLAQDLLNFSVENAHNATFDVEILEKLTTTYLSWNDIWNSKFSVEDVLQKIKKCVEEKKLSPTYAPISSVISKQLIKNLSREGISFNIIIDKFLEGKDVFKSFLMDGDNPLIKKNIIVDNIIEFLDSLLNIVENGIIV